MDMKFIFEKHIANTDLWICQFYINCYFIIGTWFPHRNNNTFIYKNWKNACVTDLHDYFSELIHPLANSICLEQMFQKLKEGIIIKFEERFIEQNRKIDELGEWVSFQDDTINQLLVKCDDNKKYSRVHWEKFKKEIKIHLRQVQVMESVKTILQCQTKKFQRPGYKPFSASVDLTKRHYLLLRKARELVKSNDDIDFAFADINCSLRFRYKNGSYI